MISRFLRTKVFLFFMLLGMLFIFPRGVFAVCDCINDQVGLTCSSEPGCNYCQIASDGYGGYVVYQGTSDDLCSVDGRCREKRCGCDTQAEAQAICDSSGLNDFQKSYYGIVVGPDNLRWTPGSNCASRQGVSATASLGVLAWEGDHYRVIGVASVARSVSTTLNPASACGYSCNTWWVVNNDTGGIVETGSGCTANFWYVPGGYKRTVVFSMAAPIPTATSTPVPCPTISASGGLACNVPGNSISWNAVTGAHHYALRVDANPTSWSGTCSSVNPGDFCNDVYALSQSYNFVPGANHTVWVAAINSCNNWSSATYLSCPGPTLTPTATIAPTATPTAVSVCAVADQPSFWVANNKTYENAIDLRWSGTSLEFQYQRFNDATCAGGVAVNNCPDPDGRDTINVNTNDGDKWVCAQVRGKNYANGGTCVGCASNNPPNCCVSNWSQISRCAFCKHPTGVSTSSVSCSGYNLSGNPSSWTGTRISWTDESAVESGFVVYRCPLNTSCPASFSQAISFPAANAGSYTDCTYGFNYGSYLYAVRCYSDSCGTVPKVTPTLIPTPTCIPSCASPLCGQANGCGGFCANTDAGVPAKTIIVSPDGTAGTPDIIVGTNSTTLMWQQNSNNKTDYYLVRAYRASDNVRVINSIVVGLTNTSLATGALSYGTVYYWQVTAYNEDCGLQAGPVSDSGYFKFDRIPGFVSLILRNESSVIVPTETGDRNHICQEEFTNRRVIFEITVSDAEGGNTIDEVWLRLRDKTVARTQFLLVKATSLTGVLSSSLTGSNASFYATVTTSVGGVNRTVNFPVQFASIFNQDLYDIEIYAKDTDGQISGWLDGGRDFKVWDCKVSVSGVMYDSTEEDLCPICPGGICFVNLATEEMNFTSLSFGSNGMTVTSPTYSDGGNKLTWGQTYAVGNNISFNDDLAGVVPVMRLPEAPAGGECANLTVDETAGVSAYEIGPAVRADFSSVLTHDPWFQVVGAGIKAKQSVVDDIPLTCVNDVLCTAAMTVSEVADIDNGLVAGMTVESGSGQYGLPLNNWVYRSNIVGQNCRYQDFYNRFYVLRGVGETRTGNVNMGDLSGSGLFFVNGNLVINENNTVDVGDFLMVAVSGVIGIGDGVDNVEGVFVADGGISAGGESETQLNIYGSLCTAGNVSFARGYVDGRVNGHAPAVKINFRPDFAFNMPGVLAKELTGWREGL